VDGRFRGSRNFCPEKKAVLIKRGVQDKHWQVRGDPSGKSYREWLRKTISNVELFAGDGAFSLALGRECLSSELSRSLGLEYPLLADKTSLSLYFPCKIRFISATKARPSSTVRLAVGSIISSKMP
jgi:hypothetical protein